MKSSKRQFLKFLGLSYLSIILFPYNLLHAVSKKIINPNLSEKQKQIMLDEATERDWARNCARDQLST